MNILEKHNWGNRKHSKLQYFTVFPMCSCLLFNLTSFRLHCITKLCYMQDGKLIWTVNINLSTGAHFNAKCHWKPQGLEYSKYSLFSRMGEKSPEAMAYQRSEGLRKATEVILSLFSLHFPKLFFHNVLKLYCLQLQFLIMQLVSSFRNLQSSSLIKIVIYFTWRNMQIIYTIFK